MLIPFFLQAIVIFLDEFYFHVRRGLPKWERIGHPIDTLSVIVCYAYILWTPYSGASLKIFIGLAVFSTILVTKDEFVHKHHCPASEQWLHALLFTLHPITLALAGIIWARMPHLQIFLAVQAGLMALFFLYQVIYWNFIWKESTTTSTTN